MYSPFDKSLTEITAQDLAVLRTVSEGWHVEYKRQRVAAESVAKSVTAMANQEGGWVFYGVVSGGVENTATEFPGIPLSEISTFLSRIRDAVARTSPAPMFEVRPVKGPCQDIGLTEDCAIVAVVVPRSWRTPHVHWNESYLHTGRRCFRSRGRKGPGDDSATGEAAGEMERGDPGTCRRRTVDL